ncbi:MAG: hypothetical protein ABWX90_02615 [Candidatus Saccharimonadales bacterium]
MARKKAKYNAKTEDDYRVVGYLFLAIAFGMFFSEATRGLAIALFTIGITFVVIGYNDADDKNKSSKKDDK